MVYPEFKTPQLEDQELLKKYFAKESVRSCDRCFVNLYLWAKYYQVKFAFFENVILFRDFTKGFRIAFPLGEEEDVKAVIPKLIDWAKEEGEEFCLYGVTKEQFDLLEEWYPDTFSIEYDRNMADYVYEAEKLVKLSGKSYHGKRNYINRFKAAHLGRWSYELLSDDNVEDCFKMALKWRNLNGCDDDYGKNAEMAVAMNSLRLYKELGLTGCLIRAEGEVVAFAIGEPLTEDTFVVHIEKAYADVEGAYALVNQQFVENEMLGKYQYVNREDDVGQENLRSTKLSYKPVFLVEKGDVTLKKE